MEVIMTVAITALVFSMIAGVLLSVIRASENIHEILATEKAGYGVLATLRQDLGGVYAYALGQNAFKGEDKTSSGRDADEIQFVSTVDVRLAEGETPKLVEIGYKIEGAEGEGERLVISRRAAALEGDPLQGDGEYVPIYSGLRSFNLEYLDPSNDEWVKKWDEGDRIPKAVRIKVTLQPEGEPDPGAAEDDFDSYEMVVGIVASLKPAENQNTAGTGTPGAPGGTGGTGGTGGSPAPPGGGG